MFHILSLQADQSFRRSRATAIAWNLALCAQIAGCDRSGDFFGDEHDASLEAGVTPDGAVNDFGPFDDVGPYLGQADCTACLQEHCPDNFDACEGEPICQDILNCRRACVGPDCHNGCPNVDPFPALRQCAEAQCGEPCALGRDFACAGRWTQEARYQPGDSVPFGLLVSDANSNGIEGMQVRVCGPDMVRCSGDEPVKLEPFGNTVELPVSAQGFEGWLRFEPIEAEPDPIEPTSRTRNVAMTNDVGVVSYLGRHSYTELAYASAGLTFDPNYASTFLVIYDCAMSLARGIVVTLDDAAECIEGNCTVGYYSAARIEPNATATLGVVPGQATFATRAGRIVSATLTDEVTRHVFARWTGIPGTGVLLADVYPPATSLIRKE